MSGRLGDGPIDEKQRELMNHLARALDRVFNESPPGGEKQTGFILMVFPFEGHEGRCNYISNAERADVVTLLKEQLRRFEGQPEQTGRG